MPRAYTSLTHFHCLLYSGWAVQTCLPCQAVAELLAVAPGPPASFSILQHSWSLRAGFWVRNSAPDQGPLGVRVSQCRAVLFISWIQSPKTRGLSAWSQQSGQRSKDLPGKEWAWQQSVFSEEKGQLSQQVRDGLGKAGSSIHSVGTRTHLSLTHN